jgi:excisionase family DNA binding protein
LFEYPPDLPPEAYSRLERALLDAETAFTTASAEPSYLETFPGAPRGGIAFVYGGEGAASDAAAQAFVLTVADTVVQTLCDTAREAQWPAHRLRRDVENLIDQLTVRTYHEKHSRRGVTLVDFATMVQQAFRASPSWAQWQGAIRERTDLAPPQSASRSTPPPTAAPRQPATTSPLPPAPIKQEALTIQQAAKLLGVHEDTIRRMAKRGDIEMISLGPKLKRIPKSEISRLRTSPKFTER